MAVVSCIPPLRNEDCILQAARVMQNTEYDLLLLSNDCEKDFEFRPVGTRPKLQEGKSSLNWPCIFHCESQTWDTDYWWLPPASPSDAAYYSGGMVEKLRYGSFVFISAQGVTDLINDLNSSFSITAVHGEMVQAGAHVAMATASYDVTYDVTESGECLNEHDERQCVGKGGGIGIPAPVSGDSPIMVFTSPAWRCLVDRMFVKKGAPGEDFRLVSMSAYSKSVACSPGGVLSLCNIGQSCIHLDNKVMEAFSQE
jgi:hypothetical protein